MSLRRLLLIGASVRAAAFSALRAQLTPTGADLFADSDLEACCPIVRIEASSYPGAVRELARAAPPSPWMYAGGLEHHPELIDLIAAEREKLTDDVGVHQRPFDANFGAARKC